MMVESLSFRERLWNRMSPRWVHLIWNKLPRAVRSDLWDGLSRQSQLRLWEALDADARQRLLWPDGPPRAEWHSFDRHPWRHPYLKPAHIRAFREFSDSWIERVLHAVEPVLDQPGRRYAFAGNMANNLYSRAKAMAARPSRIAIYPNPVDRYLMSHPAWEEYDGEAVEGVESIDAARLAGMPLPDVPDVHEHPLVHEPLTERDLPEGMRLLDLKRYRDFFIYIHTLKELRNYDALLGVQTPYLAYLTGKPYVVTQMGGDIWYEGSRDDTVGRLQRQAFRAAGAFLVSNPWSLAFARRYRMPNQVYVPYLVDENRYAPGPGECRAEWEAATGGRFFVLMTSRQDYKFKGSDVAIEGFARFSAAVPEARLVVTGWGSDRDRTQELFGALGIADKVHVVPIVGKKRVVSYLRSADCVLDQLSIGYYGAAALEAISCGRPVVMNLNQAQYDALIPEGCAPVCQAATAQDVEQRLRELQANPAHARRVGENLRAWFLLTHGNARWGRVYDAILAASGGGLLPGFGRSPLHSRLAAEEEAYHAAELATAPPFPHYF